MFPILFLDLILASCLLTLEGLVSRLLGDQLAESVEGRQVRRRAQGVVRPTGEEVLLTSGGGAAVGVLGLPVANIRFRSGLHRGILKEQEFGEKNGFPWASSCRGRSGLVAEFATN